MPPDAATASAPAERVWLALKETGPIKAEPLNPYRYALALLTGDPLPPGSRLAWLVAGNYNASNLKNKRMWLWHMSGAALTIWLTRHWTTEQRVAKAAQILAPQSAAKRGL